MGWWPKRGKKVAAAEEDEAAEAAVEAGDTFARGTSSSSGFGAATLAEAKLGANKTNPRGASAAASAEAAEGGIQEEIVVDTSGEAPPPNRLAEDDYGDLTVDEEVGAAGFDFRGAQGVEEEEAEEEEEIDAEAEMRRLERNLRKLYPHMKDMRTAVPDEELENAVKARRKASMTFNAKFVMGGTRQPDSLGARKVPPVVGVTGHSGPGGNLGINGIYELYPEFYRGRPVYQKMLEKRWESDLDANGPGVIRNTTRPPIMDQRQRFEASRSQTAFIIRAPPKKPQGRLAVWPTGDAFFLFFDPGNGCWCIGPAVGHSEIFARCPAADEPIADRLERWQVWDVGLKDWYEHKSLRTFKGGIGR